jgi:thymidylate synthase (FAD)
MRFTFDDRIRVLDHGYVCVVDRMGSDQSIERAARVSYQLGTRATRSTRGLLRYLMRHRHTTPFEVCVITLGMRIPLFVARQLVRHRMQTINEESARYSVIRDEFYVPEDNVICVQSKDNKQGRGELLPEDARSALQMKMREVALGAHTVYGEMLDEGMSRELARIILPLSTYTTWHTTMDVHNLMHMLSLRMHPHAQLETRIFANAIAEIVKDWLPITWEAFEDYRLHAASFSRMELELLRATINKKLLADLLVDADTMDARERAEFMEKLQCQS